MNILVIQQKMIGDVLASTIICKYLKKNNPLVKIYYIVNSNTLPVVLGNPFVDEIIEFKNEYRESKLSFFQFLKSLKNYKFDKVIDVYGKLESNLMSYFTKAPKKISYKKWYTSFIYTETVNEKKLALTNAGLALENRLRLVCDEKDIPKNIIAPKIYLSESEILIAKDYLLSNKINLEQPLVMISVLGSEDSKTLPADQMAQIIDQVVFKTNATILYNYIPSQKKEALQILNACNEQTKLNTRFDIFGKSLQEFLVILSHCDGLIGNEGGAVNMAKALGKPTFTVFSPWIIQTGWNMFEDGKTHISVHLEQTQPELYRNKTYADFKKEAKKFYKLYDMDFMLNKLNAFLDFNLMSYESD